MKINSVAFDIETMALSSNAIVISIGCVPFDITAENTFDELLSKAGNIYLNTDQQEKEGREVNDETLVWWSEQSPEALDWSTNKVTELLEVQLDRFSHKVYPDSVWYSRGYFDPMILSNLFNQYNIELPFKYWDWRDARTFYSAIRYDPKANKAPENFIAHNSLHDAAREAWLLQRCNLGRKKYLSGMQKAIQESEEPILLDLEAASRIIEEIRQETPKFNNWENSFFNSVSMRVDSGINLTIKQNEPLLKMHRKYTNG